MSNVTFNDLVDQLVDDADRMRLAQEWFAPLPGLTPERCVQASP